MRRNLFTDFLKNVISMDGLKLGYLGRFTRKSRVQRTYKPSNDSIITRTLDAVLVKWFTIEYLRLREPVLSLNLNNKFYELRFRIRQ